MRLPDELSGRWNHNTHYYPLALAATPCARALDVGCGDALLVRLLARRCESVVGVDPWTPADAVADVPNATLLNQDFLTAELEAGSFDLVTSMTAIHHMEFRAALTKMAGLVAPGGRLIVVSIARYTPLSWLVAGAGIVPHRVMTRRRGYWAHAAPVADATMTMHEIRRVTRELLPGAQLRHRLYWRYSIDWLNA
jgi:2-polyprenyl-3-methyl-5-hydroxy-6-metoxy-1,4-benzoquinol methylase